MIYLLRKWYEKVKANRESYGGPGYDTPSPGILEILLKAFVGPKYDDYI